MFKKICGVLSGILLVLLGLTAAALLLPRAAGYQTLAVLTGSMEPEYHVGSLIYVKETDPSLLETGDVITYRLSADTVVTHRIVEIDREEGTVTTKGDANNANDGNPIPFSNIVGRAEACIPYLGFITIYAKTPVGIGVVCGVLVLIILLTFLPEIFSEEEEQETEEPKKKKKKRKRRRKRRKRKRERI